MLNDDFVSPEQEARESVLATPADAIREYAHNYGMDHPQQAWICSPYDTWERNPFYEGPRVPHPEEEPMPELAYKIFNGGMTPVVVLSRGIAKVTVRHQNGQIEKVRPAFVKPAEEVSVEAKAIYGDHSKFNF